MSWILNTVKNMSWMWRIFFIVVVMLVISLYEVYMVVLDATPLANGEKNITEAVRAVLLSFGGVGVIISTYFTAINAFYQREMDKDKRKIEDDQKKSNIIENTFNLLAKWDDPQLFQARKWTRSVNEDETSKKKLLDDIEKNEDLKNSVILVLNYFEHVRFSLDTGRIDNDLFKRSLGTTVVKIANRFMPYAEKTDDKQVAKDLNELIEKLK